MLNLSPANLICTVINLLILYFIVKKLLFGPVNAILAKRQEILDKQFKDADAAKEQALALQKQYEASLSGIEETKTEFAEKAREDAQGEYERIVEQAQNKAKKIMIDATGNAEAERKKILKKAETEITDIVIKAAAKTMAIDIGTKGNQALYEQFLIKAGDRSDANSN